MLLTAGLIFLLAGFVKGVVGLGLPAIAMGLLSLSMPPVQAATLLLLPTLVSNAVQVLPLRDAGAILRRIWPLILGVVAGIVLGFALWGGLAGRGAEQALGVLLMVYAGLGFTAWKPRLPERSAVPVGLVTGGIAAATGVFVLPATFWLQSIGLGRADFVRALGLSLGISSLAMGVMLARMPSFGLDDVAASALALAPVLAGQWAGTRLRHRLSEAAFRRVFLVGLMALGFWLVLKG